FGINEAQFISFMGFGINEAQFISFMGLFFPINWS
ncbi:Uncharacterized protein TCM_024054 isoform 2, partial [Theobroma cacao]